MGLATYKIYLNYLPVYYQDNGEEIHYWLFEKGDRGFKVILPRTMPMGERLDKVWKRMQELTRRPLEKIE